MFLAWEAEIPIDFFGIQPSEDLDCFSLLCLFLRPISNRRHRQGKWVKDGFYAAIGSILYYERLFELGWDLTENSLELGASSCRNLKS